MIAHSPSATAVIANAKRKMNNTLGSFLKALVEVDGNMIAFLEGILAEALPTQIVVNVQGVGYQVMIPISSFERLPEPGSKVKILTHLAVREDAHVLYGFYTAGERDLFKLLLNHVTGVGTHDAAAQDLAVAVGFG